MLNISVVIITFNEEKNIEQCIRSVSKVADEIIVVDSFSTDKTEEISKRFGALFIQNPFTGYSDQKNFAISKSKYNYILSLDADEALSIELEESILKIKSDWRYDAYKFNRLNYYCGKWIYYTDWYPDRKIRLFDKRKGEWQGHIHETIRMNENTKVGYLRGDLLHWRYNTYEEHLEEINRFSTLSANEYFRKGIKSGIFKIVFHPLWRFFHSYILRGGFLNGYNGFTISRLSSLLCLAKYLKLKNLYMAKNSGSVEPDMRNIFPASTGLRIGFDAKRAFYNRSGLGNYSRNLIESLVKYEPGNSFFMFTPGTKKRIIFSEETEKRLSIISPDRFYHRVLGSLWRSKFMSGDLKKYRVGIYHGLSHELPFGIHKTGVKTVVTVHDLIFLRFPEFYGAVNVFIYRKKIEYACRIADKIVAISSQTRDDLIEFLNADPRKIEVIHQSCNAIFLKKISLEEYQSVKAKHGLPEKYLLYVGTIEERKNLLNILKALKAKSIDIPLVVIGRKTDYYYKTIKPFLDENKMDIIIFPSVINNDELPGLYQNALCFIYPSFFEGFGIPILEAIISGTPVITSRGGCFEETGGPGAIYVDPHNPDEIGDAVLQITGDPELRSSLIEKGFEHAKIFSSELVAERYMNLYKALINNT